MPWSKVFVSSSVLQQFACFLILSCTHKASVVSIFKCTILKFPMSSLHEITFFLSVDVILVDQKNYSPLLRDHFELVLLICVLKSPFCSLFLLSFVGPWWFWDSHNKITVTQLIKILKPVKSCKNLHFALLDLEKVLNPSSKCN